MSAEKNSREFSGSLTVEAAFLLPILVLTLIPFLYLIRMMIFSALFEWDVQEAMSRLSVISYALTAENAADNGSESGSGKSSDSQREKAKQAASEDREEKVASYSGLMGELGTLFSGSDLGEAAEDTVLEAAGALYLRLTLQERWDSETLEAWGVSGGWNGISFGDSSFFYQDESRHRLLKADMDVSWSSLGGMYTPEDGNIVCICHAFTGEQDAASSAGGSGEEAEDEETVYRIGSGMHYHVLSCFLISKKTSSMSASAADAAGYEPCLLCGGGSGTVYVSSGGECYHTSTCSVLFPDLTAMTLEEAEAAGLTPCGLCFGDNDYFH